MPCRPGLTGCRRGCRHRASVDAYRAARIADEQARDIDVGAYGPGSPEWAEYRPLITFHQWLRQMRTT